MFNALQSMESELKRLENEKSKETQRSGPDPYETLLKKAQEEERY